MADLDNSQYELNVIEMGKTQFDKYVENSIEQKIKEQNDLKPVLLILKPIPDSKSGKRAGT